MPQSSPQSLTMEVDLALERRRQARAQLPISLRVSRQGRKAEYQLVSTRDANVRGAFFYSDMEVEIGETLDVEVASRQALAKLNVNCEARVVRVEECGIDGLTGVAVQFDGFRAEEPAWQEDPTRPFVRWSVEMVERMFARRPELEICASRIQGAA
jgi:hypothetical protein